MTGMSGGRLSGLDALRGLAAIAVVLHHYTGDSAHTLYSALQGRPILLAASVDYGHYGVELFFIVSGFVILMTLDRSKTFYDFAASRIARLWPAFLFCMFITVSISASWNLPWAPQTRLPNLLANVTMAPALFRARMIDASYWTLQYELSFYLLAAAGYFLSKGRRIELFCFLWLAAKGVSGLTGSGPVQRWVDMLLALEFAPLFVIGVLLYLLRSKKGHWTCYPLLLLCVAMCGMGPFRPMPTISYKALVCVFASLVWLGSMDRSPLRYLYPLVFLGSISYPLYLVHQTAGYGVISQLLQAGFGANAAVLITIVIAILMSYAIHRSVERPGQRAVRSLFARWRSRILGGAETESEAPLP